MNHARANWFYAYGTGTGRRVAKPSRASFRVDLPGPGGSVNYVWTESGRMVCRNGRRRPGDAIRIAGTITLSEGAEIVDADDDVGGAAPAFRPMLCKNMTGANGRWWAGESVPLVEGPFDLTMPLSPSAWTQVYGQPGDGSNALSRAFHQTITGGLRVALTFGAGHDYGHGVKCASGTASVRVNLYQS